MDKRLLYMPLKQVVDIPQWVIGGCACRTGTRCSRWNREKEGCKQWAIVQPDELSETEEAITSLTAERDALRAELEQMVKRRIIYNKEYIDELQESILSLTRQRDLFGTALERKSERLAKAERIICNLASEAKELGGRCAECRPSTHLQCTECNMGEAHDYVAQMRMKPHG